MFNFVLLYLFRERITSAPGKVSLVDHVLLASQNLPPAVLALPVGNDTLTALRNELERQLPDTPYYISRTPADFLTHFRHAHVASDKPQLDRYEITGYIESARKYKCLDGRLLEKTTPIDRERSAKAIRCLCDLLPNCLALLLASITGLSFLSSTLLKKNSEHPSFAIAVLGPTGSKKTSLAKALFNYPFFTQVDTNFKSTIAAVQGTLQKARDRPVIIDDAFPGLLTEEKNNMRKILSLILRAVGDVGGMRQRYNAAETDACDIECLPVITGEKLPLTSQSDRLRIIRIALTAKTVNLNALSTLQKDRSLMRALYDAFIITTVLPSDASHLQQCFEIYREKTRPAFKTADRMAANAAWLFTGLNIFDEFMKNIPEYSPARTEEASTALQNLLAAQVTSCSDASLLDKLMHHFFTLLDCTPSLLLRSARGDQGVLLANTSGSCIGFFDNYFLYLNIERLIKQVRRQLDDDNLELFESLSSRRIRSLMYEQHLVDTSCHTPSHLTISYQVNYTSYRVTKLYRESMCKRWPELRSYLEVEY